VVRKSFQHFSWLLLSLAILLPWVGLPTTHASGIQSTHGSPLLPRIRPHVKSHPHHIGQGVNRSHLSTLPLLALQTRRAGTNARHPHGALISSNIDPQLTNTLFFDDMESGATGWTTIGDNNTTPYYSNGHDFWNLVQNPNSLSVPSFVNPALVSYPDSTGNLPVAHSGTHAWWYGNNPAYDPQNPSGASMTYMGNQSDWPTESAGDGGTSNGPNSASLISPSIDLTSTPNATLTFATWWEIESVNPAHFDMMYVDVSANGGAWTTLGVLNPTNNPEGGADQYPYTSNGLDAPASWQMASVDLSSYIGSHVQVRFRFDSVDQYDNGFRGWFIDDVGVYSNTPSIPTVDAVSPNSGTVGDSITISGSGFGATQNSSTITFNGVNASVQSWSDSNIVTSVPAGATNGPLVVTVNGQQSSAVEFTVNAAVALSSPTAAPKTIDTISGQGFAANEPIKVYLKGVNGTLLASSTADSKGNLPTTKLTVPIVSAGNYLVLARGKTSKITGGTTLSVIPALVPSVSTVKTSQTINLAGIGFAANDYVYVQIDNTQNGNIGYLTCNNNGKCNGSATMPSSSEVQGMHLLIGSSSNGLIAEVPMTFKPSLVLSINYNGARNNPPPSRQFKNIISRAYKPVKGAPIGGGPGSALYLAGASFAGNETLQVYWGTQINPKSILEGSVTSDAYGNLSFYFNAPTGVKAGQFMITVERTQQHPSSVATNFQVLPPGMISTAGILSGQSVSVQLSGFQAYEQVNISWNANGGQQVATFYMDSTGATLSSFTPPSAPKGNYTLTATGVASNLQTTSVLTIGPGILLAPNTSNPGSTITVMGGGYQAGEKLNIYFQTQSNGIVSATADATGAFTVPLTIPTTYSQNTSYFVYAVSTNGNDSASAQFYFTAPGVGSNSYYVNYGSQTTIYGQGFAANESVNLFWNYNQNGQTQVATVTAASDGTFSDTITVPSDPGLGGVNIAAQGVVSQLIATNSVYEYASITLTPSSGTPGIQVMVNGGGFGGTEPVTIYYQNTSIGTATTDNTGAFSLTFTVPTNSGLGYNYMLAQGNNTGIQASAYFYVTPNVTISPTTGPSGTAITVNGTYFTPNSYGWLYWYDPSTGSQNYLNSFNTDNNGAFTANITAPSGLISGNTYYVQAYDGSTNVMAQAAFVAQ
jgi:hypothetical protein